jgi:ATP citrate (pro-S)-lyase
MERSNDDGADRCRWVSSVAYVSRSGGMSNELNNIISRNTNGVVEGVAIGGDRYPGTTFMDHLIRYQNDPDVSSQNDHF